MISKSDVILLLSELGSKGVDTEKQLKETITNGVTMEVLDFINKNRQLDLGEFYEKLRWSYNNKKSNLYINIVKDKGKEPKDILTTLASLNLQILLFSKHVDDLPMFLRFARFEEIQKVMLNYSKTFDIIPCQKLLELFKVDLKTLEEITRKQ